MISDADGDIAALVYSAGDRPDLVLCAFAEHLAAAGKRLCGQVQFRDGARDGSPGRVMVLDSWQIRGRHDSAANSHCRLDAGWLNQMGTVNRFGPLEAAGRGFRDAILAASETQTPLIIAVPEFEFERWTQFSRGMTVRLECTLDSVLCWWRRVSSEKPSDRLLHTQACELFK
jgi:hypothetical protein